MLLHNLDSTFLGSPFSNFLLRGDRLKFKFPGTSHKKHRRSLSHGSLTNGERQDLKKEIELSASIDKLNGSHHTDGSDDEELPQLTSPTSNECITYISSL